MHQLGDALNITDYRRKPRSAALAPHGDIDTQSAPVVNRQHIPSQSRKLRAAQSCALAEVNELLDRDLAGNAKEGGAYFIEQLKTLPHVKEARGQGLLVGVEFDDSISGVEVKHECIKRKLLITAIGAHIIRMIPPLIVTKEDCDKAVAIIREAVESL